MISSGGSLTSFIARFDTAGNYIDRFNGLGFGGNLFITSQGDYFSVAQGYIGAKINTRSYDSDIFLFCTKFIRLG